MSEFCGEFWGFLGTQIGSRNQDLFWTDLRTVNSYGVGLVGLLIVVIFG